jgi:hypothetical protein
MGDFLDGLGALADQIGQDIVAFLQYLLSVLVAVFQFLYSLLAAVFNFFLDLVKRIGQLFITLWTQFFKGIFASLWSAIVKVHDWLESVLSPIIHFLQQIRAWVDWFFQTYVKPLLNLINQVRSFLNILRAFGIKWAAQLDALLGKVEADIAGAFLKIQGYLNALIGIVNSLADPLGLFRRPTFVMSMRRIFPSFLRGISGMPVGYFFPSPRKGAGAGLGAPSFPFSAISPAQNPPPSGYLSGDDGLGDFGGVAPGDTIPDYSMDSMYPLDFFNDDLYPDPECTDPVSCLAALQQQAANAITGGDQ